MEIDLKYGKEAINIQFPDGVHLDVLKPSPHPYHPLRELSINRDPLIRKLTRIALPATQVSVGVAINDKTRPVPYDVLLPPLLTLLFESGIVKQNIEIFIANGTHVPPSANEMSYLPAILNGFRIRNHDCDAVNELSWLGLTSRNTPVWINKAYLEKDLKIAVGNIEPHHFAGYSGGAKTVSIGLAGRETITKNHTMITDPAAIACNYLENPIRQEVEEIGRMVELDLCLNCLQDENKKLLKVFWDTPSEVITQAAAVVDELFTINTEKRYDLVIASAGGFPKDINLYQAQKALTNAARITKPGGEILLVAYCQEGSGSEIFGDYMRQFLNPEQVIKDFTGKPFQIGKHKAFQFSLILQKAKVFLKSQIQDHIVKNLMLEPVSDVSAFIKGRYQFNPAISIAILPEAVLTVPVFLV